MWNYNCVWNYTDRYNMDELGSVSWDGLHSKKLNTYSVKTHTYSNLISPKPTTCIYTVLLSEILFFPESQEN